MLRGVLGHDDAEIHHHADRDRDAREAHDVGAHARQVHDEEGEKHTQRQAHCHRQARPHVQQKRDHDDHRGHHRLLQRRGHRRRGLVDELRTVVERNYRQLFPLQRRPQVDQPSFHRIDHRFRILLHPHADDRTDVFLISVREQPLTELSAQPHVRNVPEPQARALRAVTSNDNVFDILDRPHKADAADHRLHPALLHAHRADIASSLPDGHHQHFERDALCFQPEGIDVDLVLAHHPARRRHFGDARDGAERRLNHLVEQVAFEL